jgi:hypothetical protein
VGESRIGTDQVYRALLAVRTDDLSLLLEYWQCDRDAGELARFQEDIFAHPSGASCVELVLGAPDELAAQPLNGACQARRCHLGGKQQRYAHGDARYREDILDHDVAAAQTRTINED